MDSLERRHRNQLEQLQAEATGLEWKLTRLEATVAQAARATTAAQSESLAVKARLVKVRGEVQAEKRRISAFTPLPGQRLVQAGAAARGWAHQLASRAPGLLGLGMATLATFVFVPALPPREIFGVLLGFLLVVSAGAILLAMFALLIQMMIHSGGAVGSD